jgi:hypothetical protein
MGAQSLLAGPASFDFPDTFKNFLTDLTFGHLQFPLRFAAEYERECFQAR